MRFKNEPENNFAELAEKNGWRSTKRGWPDFLCFSIATGECIAVEVKPRNERTGFMKLLKRDQAACLDFLTSKGVRCFVSDGVTLERYNREVHAPEWRRRRSG